MRPFKEPISPRILLGSSVLTGNGSESIDGLGLSVVGEDGRDADRLTSLLPGFLLFIEPAFCICGLAGAIDGNAAEELDTDALLASGSR